MKGSRPSPGRQRGYVLLATLGAIVVLAAMIGFFASRIDLVRENTRALQAVADSRVSQANAFAEVMFRLATLPQSSYGFGGPGNGLAADSRPYLVGSTIVRLQDTRGLVSANGADPAFLWNFLALRGLPAETVDRLVDTLEDYTDTDDLVRLNGAEARQYAELGLPPPANDWIRSTAELNQIIGWRDLLQKRPELERLFSASREAYVNPNTATRELLESLPGATVEGVDRLLKFRREGVLGSLTDLLAVSGIAANPEMILFFPGAELRLELYPREGGPAAEYNVLLTLGSAVKPWQTLEMRTRPDHKFADDKDAQPLPGLAPPAPATTDTPDGL